MSLKLRYIEAVFAKMVAEKRWGPGKKYAQRTSPLMDQGAAL